LHKRKNWYFFGSDESGLQASIMLSIFSTCLRHNVEPGAYLYDVLLRLTADPACDPQQLLPYNWTPRSSLAEIEDVKDTPKVPAVTQ